MLDVLVYGLAISVGIGLFGAMSAAGFVAASADAPHSTPTPQTGRVLALNTHDLHSKTGRADFRQEGEAA